MLAEALPQILCHCSNIFYLAFFVLVCQIISSALPNFIKVRQTYYQRLSAKLSPAKILKSLCPEKRIATKKMARLKRKYKHELKSNKEIRFHESYRNDYYFLLLKVLNAALCSITYTPFFLITGAFSAALSPSQYAPLVLYFVFSLCLTIYRCIPILAVILNHFNPALRHLTRRSKNKSPTRMPSNTLINDPKVRFATNFLLFFTNIRRFIPYLFNLRLRSFRLATLSNIDYFYLQYVKRNWISRKKKWKSTPKESRPLKLYGGLAPFFFLRAHSEKDIKATRRRVRHQRRMLYKSIGFPFPGLKDKEVREKIRQLLAGLASSNEKLKTKDNLMKELKIRYEKLATHNAGLKIDLATLKTVMSASKCDAEIQTTSVKTRGFGAQIGATQRTGETQTSPSVQCMETQTENATNSGFFSHVFTRPATPPRANPEPVKEKPKDIPANYAKEPEPFNTPRAAPAKETARDTPVYRFDEPEPFNTPPRATTAEEKGRKTPVYRFDEPEFFSTPPRAAPAEAKERDTPVINFDEPEFFPRSSRAKQATSPSPRGKKYSSPSRAKKNSSPSPRGKKCSSPNPQAPKYAYPSSGAQQDTSSARDDQQYASPPPRPQGKTGPGPQEQRDRARTPPQAAPRYNLFYNSPEDAGYFNADGSPPREERRGNFSPPKRKPQQSSQDNCNKDEVPYSAYIPQVPRFTDSEDEFNTPTPIRFRAQNLIEIEKETDRRIKNLLIYHANTFEDAPHSHYEILKSVYLYRCTLHARLRRYNIRKGIARKPERIFSPHGFPIIEEFESKDEDQVLMSAFNLLHKDFSHSEISSYLMRACDFINDEHKNRLLTLTPYFPVPEILLDPLPPLPKCVTRGEKPESPIRSFKEFPIPIPVELPSEEVLPPVPPTTLKLNGRKFVKFFDDHCSCPAKDNDYGIKRLDIFYSYLYCNEYSQMIVLIRSIGYFGDRPMEVTDSMTQYRVYEDGLDFMKEESRTTIPTDVCERWWAINNMRRNAAINTQEDKFEKNQDFRRRKFTEEMFTEFWTKWENEHEEDGKKYWAYCKEEMSKNWDRRQDMYEWPYEMNIDHSNTWEECPVMQQREERFNAAWERMEDVREEEGFKRERRPHFHELIFTDYHLFRKYYKKNCGCKSH